MIGPEFAFGVYLVIALGAIGASPVNTLSRFAAALPFFAIAVEGWQGGASLAAVMLGSFAWGLGYAVTMQEERRGGA